MSGFLTWTGAYLSIGILITIAIKKFDKEFGRENYTPVIFMWLPLTIIYLIIKVDVALTELIDKLDKWTDFR